MNKKYVFARALPVLLLVVSILIISGCDEFANEEDFYTMRATHEQLYNIKTLDLETVEVKEQQEVEVAPMPPEEIELTLEKCRTIALEHNLEIKAELISPSIAKEGLDAEEAKFEWLFSGNARLIKTDTPTSTALEGAQAEIIDTSLGVDVPLRTGGNLNFNLANNYTETDNAFSTLNPSYSNDLSFSISQPLLRNAGKRANTHSIRIADYDSQITDARTKLKIISVLQNTDKIYWRLYAARRELELRKEEYDLAIAQLERSKRFVEAGELPQIEVLRAEAGAAQRLQAIIITENLVRDRQRDLKQALNKPGLDVETLTTIIPATLPDPVNYQFEGDKLTAAAVDNRMEMLEIELEIAKDISTIDFRNNQTLPAADLSYRYNVNGLGRSRNDSLDVVWDKNFEDHVLGLNVQIPLGNEVANSALTAARLRRIQRLSTKENRQTMIELEVLQAIDQVEAAWQKILASRQSSVLQGRLHEAEQRQFEIGLRTNTDVLEAQANFADAQSSEILALADYQIALVDIASATGTILGAAKVQWEPVVPGVNQQADAVKQVRQPNY